MIATDAVFVGAGGDGSVLTIIDSGSSLHLSGDTADFRWINPEPTVRLYGVGGQVAGGRPAGREGILKPNSLGNRKSRVPTHLGRETATFDEIAGGRRLGDEFHPGRSQPYASR